MMSGLFKMNKFKVGDKVKIIGNVYYNYCGYIVSIDNTIISLYDITHV